jgi:hypothetical protein
MGQGTARVDQDPQQLETEITGLRDELGTLVAELDRRRHEALDIRLQLRRHAWAVAAAGTGVAATVAGLIWLVTRRAQRRNRLTAKASRLREGIARIVERPEGVATQPTMVGQLLMAAATAAAAMATRKAVEYLVRQMVDGDRREAASASASDTRPLKAA